MMAVNNQISFSSYNIKHYDSTKIDAVKDIFKNSSFMILQETWLTESEFTRRFKNDFPNGECFASSRMEQEEIRPGRPYGGVAICYHSNLRCQVENIPTESKSICVLKISFHDLHILLVNVYMPSSDNTAALNMYDTILQEISIICNKYPTHSLILGGDWNADPSRNDGRTQLFKRFILQEDLCNSLYLDCANVSHTYKCTRNDTESTLDHFLLSPNMTNFVTSYESLDLHNNFSDHSPIMLKLDVDIESFNTVRREFQPNVAWHKCTQTDIQFYQNMLDNILLKEVNPSHEAFRCRDKKCTEHSKFLCDLYDTIIKACNNASKSCLPYTTQNGGKRVIPGWNEYVKEHADRAKMWHEIWVGKGKPRDRSFIAMIKRKTNLQYHYAIRYVMKENARLRNIRMAEAISVNDDRTLWDEVRKISRTNHNLPSMIDGHAGADEITNIFSNKYNTLYNSVSYDSDDMDKLKRYLDEQIDNNSTLQPHTVTVQDVKDAINSLKMDKKEENGLYSNHFRYGTKRLYIIITLLFNSMMFHGIAPDSFLLGTMIPLIKNNRGNRNCSDNYRSLTIGTGLSKLLDIIIIDKQSDALSTSDLQFGFKEKSSTTMCTFMVLETIEYYRNNGGNVHAILLDASKAFDRVNYTKLFEKLIKKGMCPLTVRLLLNMYTNQKMQVKWSNHISPKFSISNGVRQGGVLSPLLFSVYVDELLEKLRRNGAGCHIGHMFVGALGYADDIILLCPSVYGLKDMIKICEEYASEHDIIFNGKKSKYLVFGDYKYNPTIKVNNEEVTRCESALHLGNLLCTKDTQNSLVDHTLRSFKSSFHNFMSKFRSCNTTTKNKLFNQYCSSMYGSQLWNLTCPNVDKICTQWRKYHRIALSVPYQTHCDLLPLISDNMPLDCMLDCRFFSFYRSLINSENNLVKFTASNITNLHSSTLYNNIRYLQHKYDMSIEDILSMSKRKVNETCHLKWLSTVNQDYPIYASIIRDMMCMKEDRCTRNFTNEECDGFISFLCTI